MKIYESKYEDDGVYRVREVDEINCDDNFWSTNGEEEFFDYDKFYNMIKQLFLREYISIEHNYVAVFNREWKCKGVFKIATGDERSVSSCGRDYIFGVMSLGGISVINIHNHPNNIVTPSGTDIHTHIKNYKALHLSSVLLFDSIVIGDDDYFSFQENGIWNPNLDDYGLQELIEETEIDNELDKDEPWFQYFSEEDCEKEICAQISRKMYRKKYDKKED